MYLYPQLFINSDGIETKDGSLTASGLIIALISMGMTGLGATAGLLSGLTSVARSYPASTVSLDGRRFASSSSSSVAACKC